MRRIWSYFILDPGRLIAYLHTKGTSREIQDCLQSQTLSADGDQSKGVVDREGGRDPFVYMHGNVVAMVA